MRPSRTAVLTLIAATCVWTPAVADAPSNPYLSVVERNAFQLKDPPPPKIEAPPPPAVPLPKIVLTGIITSLFGSEPKVLIEITEQEPGKPANVKKPIMRQGEKDGMIEILAVDVANNQVRIRNGTVETNITFEVAKSSPSPTPGLPTLPGMVPPPNVPAAQGMPPTAAAAPMIISPGGANAAGRANTGVSTYNGAGMAAIPTATAPVNYANNAATYASAGLNSGTYNNANYNRGASALNSGIATYGAGNIPAREPRTDPAAQTQQQKLDNYAGAAALEKVANEYNRQHNIPPLPVPKSLYH